MHLCRNREVATMVMLNLRIAQRKWYATKNICNNKWMPHLRLQCQIQIWHTDHFIHGRFLFVLQMLQIVHLANCTAHSRSHMPAIHYIGCWDLTEKSDSFTLWTSGRRRTYCAVFPTSRITVTVWHCLLLRSETTCIHY